MAKHSLHKGGTTRRGTTWSCHDCPYMALISRDGATVVNGGDPAVRHDVPSVAPRARRSNVVGPFNLGP